MEIEDAIKILDMQKIMVEIEKLKIEVLKLQKEQEVIKEEFVNG